MRPARRRALLIGTESHRDSRYATLPSTPVDLSQMQQVLENRRIGGFEPVRVLTDLTADDMRAEIAEFLESFDADELALLYVTGHGTRLSRSTGEFYFVATDTNFDQVDETGVSADYVNEQLENCLAAQKVVLLDCCRSGGFALGWRTSDVHDHRVAKGAAQPAPLTGRGVYVISSSGAGEDSFAGPQTPGAPQPSLFTGEVVRTLLSGKAAKDGSGHVSVDDLFEYVNRQMRQRHGQIPVKSALHVNTRIILADCPQGRPPVLAPITKAAKSAATAPATSVTAKAAATTPSWERLLDYYRQCVLSDGADLPLLKVRDEGTTYACVTGSERFLSGDLDENGCAEVPPGAAALVAKAAKEGAELWAGYPVVLFTPPNELQARTTPQFAPLLIRRVEVVDGNGDIRLKPYGPVTPNQRLTGIFLPQDEARLLHETYLPSWHAGQHDRMAADMASLLRNDLGRPQIEELRPENLTPRIDIRTPAEGARNTEVLFIAKPDAIATKRLLEDLADISGKASQIPETALAALLPGHEEPPQDAPPAIQPITPLAANDAQLAVLDSVFRRRLTVATGPPGTGKSQLVANVVATAVANGRSVLVASTNNRAVDEVWQRCEQLVPGSLIRTGSREYQQKQEVPALQDLLKRAGPPPGSATTLRTRLRLLTDDLLARRKELSEISRLDLKLRQAGEQRESQAARLGGSIAKLAGRLGSADDVVHWRGRARRAATARLFGPWRRTRLLRRLGLPTPADDPDAAATCTALADFADAEHRWRLSRRRLSEMPDDVRLTAHIDEMEEQAQELSTRMLEHAVNSGAHRGRQSILKVLQKQQQRESDWGEVARLLAYLRGWAVTSLSARRYPPNPALFDLVIIDEASQCSIPQVIPLLFRARRALVIGDVMQLTHISKLPGEYEASARRDAGLRADVMEKHRMGYRRHSAFHAAEHAAGGSILLDEHYRCHPDIAAVSNDLFYGGQLIVLTDIRSRPMLDLPAIIWAEAHGQAQRIPGSSWVNEAEINKVLGWVEYAHKHLPAEATIGVVTPFAAQQRKLAGRLTRYGDRVQVGTVHTFQGSERDVMILSLVAAPGMEPGTIDWVGLQLNLWNVAITRARSHLIVVGDPVIWRKYGGVGAHLWHAAQAERQSDGESGDPRDAALLPRLLSGLESLPGATVDLKVPVHGHTADALVALNGTTTAVLLDHGPDADTARPGKESRHMRLMLRRCQLLRNPHDAVRLPVWCLYDRQALHDLLGRPL
ncbi:AAA domain-containing protein [Thermopolyspora sp. NPDC052614]|uniref:caspase, EACC1-associated type n=1 Tax=Thermopolyspora sp. NPDC052614 TaxID=3155682 RepID=UPI0034371BBF